MLVPESYLPARGPLKGAIFILVALAIRRIWRTIGRNSLGKVSKSLSIVRFKLPDSAIATTSGFMFTPLYLGLTSGGAIPCSSICSAMSSEVMLSKLSLVSLTIRSVSACTLLS